jgi:hypothetical protein
MSMTPHRPESALASLIQIEKAAIVGSRLGRG